MNKVVVEARKSPYIGVGLDESTDRAKEKHVVFIIRYLHGDKVKTTYLQIEKVNDGKAHTMYDAMRRVFAGHQIPLKKVCNNVIFLLFLN